MRKFLGLLILFLLTLSYGCAGTLERGAKGTGKAVGKVISVPVSAGEGVAEGIKGEDGPNPYGR